MSVVGLPCSGRGQTGGQDRLSTGLAPIVALVTPSAQNVNATSCTCIDLYNRTDVAL